MSPVIACPRCSTSVQVLDNAAGKNARCPACKQVFGAPRNPLTAPAGAGNGRMAAPDRPCHKCSAANAPGASTCAACRAPLLILGDYRVERFLKEGGFGAIYAAMDRKHQNRAVVIKEMIQADPKEFEKRLDFFYREYDVLRFLNGKKLTTIPKAYSFYADKRMAYLMLEYIPGQNLLEYLEAHGNRPIAVAQAVEWGKLICDVLALLHGRSPPWIHRDIKPENIMLLEDNRSIKMIDFGTARDMGNRLKTRLYSEVYSAPEQALRSAEVRSDIFAVAATLYHLVTGMTPEAGATRQHVDALLADPTRIRTEDRWFFELLSVNLSASAKERYPSVALLREDLERKRVRSRAELYPDDVPPGPVPRPEPTDRSAAPPPPPEPADRSPAPTANPVAVQMPPQEPVAMANPPPPVPIPNPAWQPPEPVAPARRSFPWWWALLLLGGLAVGVALEIRTGWLKRNLPTLLAYFKQAEQSGKGKDKEAKDPALGEKKDNSRGEKSSRTDKNENTAAAPKEPPDTARPFKARLEVLQAIQTDLQKDATARPYRRYFTLDHIYNDARVRKQDLDRYARALTDLLRQYSPTAAVTFEPLEQGAVYRVDLHQFGWEKSRAWSRILAAYPYCLRDREVQDLEALAGDEIPFVRADWFIATASHNPLAARLRHPTISTDAVEVSEAMAGVAKAYEANLDAQQAALELGLRSADELARKIDADLEFRKAIARLQLNGLVKGGSITRRNWDSMQRGLETPFQEVAVRLGLGPSYRVRDFD